MCRNGRYTERGIKEIDGYNMGEVTAAAHTWTRRPRKESSS